jgi:hypothetical protein
MGGLEVRERNERVADLTARDHDPSAIAERAAARDRDEALSEERRVREARGEVFDHDGTDHGPGASFTLAATPAARPQLLEVIAQARPRVDS